jgi:2-phosphoglycerate kinase
MVMDPRAESLRHVRWIGGGSGAGKSTLAARIAASHGIDVYPTDEAMAAHAGRADPATSPHLQRFLAMTMDERWVDRTPAEMLATFPWFRGEGFDLVVEDLGARTGDRGVVVEGFRVLPHLVRPLVTDEHQAVWLLPTPAFRELAIVERGTGWEFLDRTSDPARARHNLLERDRLFTDRLRVECEAAGLAAIEVDVGTTEHQLAEVVARALRLDA